MTSRLLQDLNDAQREAVQCVEGPLLVLAGAGSGKTRVLTYRIAYLIEQRLAYPNQILAVTFTNKAANEMKRRVEALLGTAVEGMWIGTFHSICARILRIEAEHLGYDSNFTIYDVDDQIRLIQQVMEGLNISQEIIKPRQVHYTISDCKNKMLSPAEYEKRASTVPEQHIARIYHEYEKAKRRSNAFDFDDLLLMPLELFTRDKAILEKYQKKFRYILVDEYQDTNKAQYHLIRLLGAQHRNICVVGDEDQSIYRWRGADIENILTFEKDYPECTVIRLEQNYRSTQVILDAANAVVANNQKRLGKNLWSRKKGGKKISRRVTLNEEHEAAEVVKIILQEMQEHPYNYNDFAVLYRTNAQSRALEERLRRANIPYTIVGGIKFYERKEIKDILAYLRLIANPRDSVALRRIINFPTRGIGTVTLGRLEAFALKHQIGVYEAARRVDEVEELSTNARKRIREFVETIDALREKAREVNAFEIVQEVVNTFRLLEMYQGSRLPEDQARVENIQELLNSILTFTRNNPPEEATLTHYLEEISLVTDIDRWDPSQATVTLMTLHSAKGLEFPVVIITGLEDGLFPLARSVNQDEDLEEERRLFYVGMTRAKESLYLLWAQERQRFGNQQWGGGYFYNAPSRFLREIPEHLTKEEPVKIEPDLEYIYDDQEDEGGEFRIGDWVVHDKFGKGQVLAVENSSTGTKVKVLFETKGLKTLVTEYANLRPWREG